LLFENRRIRISDFRLPPGETGGHAHHTLPTLRWQVGEGLHFLHDADGRCKDAAPAHVADKHTFWVAPGETFRCTNAHCSSVYRQICWEFKQRPQRTEAEVLRLLASAVFSTDVGTSLLFENAYCRAWDFYLEPGGGDHTVPHHHVLDYCFVYVAAGRLLGSHHDGTLGLFDSVNEDQDVTWFDSKCRLPIAFTGSDLGLKNMQRALT